MGTEGKKKFLIKGFSYIIIIITFYIMCILKDCQN